MFDVFVASSTSGIPIAEIISKKLEDTGLFNLIRWWDGSFPSQGDSILDKIFNSVKIADFAIFVATPDDLVIRKGKYDHVVRDNVLLEYGFFAGKLGRKRALIFQVGPNVQYPSDLNGILKIVCEKEFDRNFSRSTEFKNKFSELLVNILAAKSSVRDEIVRASYADGFDTELLLELLTIERERQLGSKSTNPEIKSVTERVQKYVVQEKISVGEQKTTQTKHFLKLQKDDNFVFLGNAYANFIANRLITKEQYDIPTRIAIHDKKLSNKDMMKYDMKFLNYVVKRLSIKPAIVKTVMGESTEVLGFYERGEKTILIHDITISGTIPFNCMDGLQSVDLKTFGLFSFVVRKSNFDAIKRTCESKSLFFEPFLQLCDETGEISSCL